MSRDAVEFANGAAVRRRSGSDVGRLADAAERIADALEGANAAQVAMLDAMQSSPDPAGRMIAAEQVLVGDGRVAACFYLLPDDLGTLVFHATPLSWPGFKLDYTSPDGRVIAFYLASDLVGE